MELGEVISNKRPKKYVEHMFFIVGLFEIFLTICADDYDDDGQVDYEDTIAAKASPSELRFWPLLSG